LGHSGQTGIIRKHFQGKYGAGMKNIFGYLCWNLYLLVLHLKLKPKIIHAYDFDTIFPALIASIFIKCKVVYDIADWFTVSRSKGHYLKPVIDKAERWACKKADLIILAHEKRINELGFLPKKWFVVYNTPQDLPASQLQTGHQNMETDTYFTYIGVLQPDRGIEQIIEAVSPSRRNLVIAGFGRLSGLCLKAAEESPNIKFLGQISSYKQTLGIEANALAIIALYDPKLPGNLLSAPNKLYEAMMVGKPLITTEETLTGKFVTQEGIGIAVPYGEPQALNEALDYLEKNCQIRQEMGRRARLLYENHYSFKKQCDKIQGAYSELLNSLPGAK
jgi:glycosyltransferase involved in cell wall biosynthesis